HDDTVRMRHGRVRREVGRDRWLTLTGRVRGGEQQAKEYSGKREQGAFHFRYLVVPIWIRRARPSKSQSRLAESRNRRLTSSLTVRYRLLAVCGSKDVILERCSDTERVEGLSGPSV